MKLEVTNQIPFYFSYMYSPEYFQGLWGDRNTANFDEQRLLATVKISQV
jgi:hypothetical protein